MSAKRIRRKTFDPAFRSMSAPMYWLSKRNVPRAIIADIFNKTPNDVSVNATNQSVREREPKLTDLPPEPDISLALPELEIPQISRYDDLEEKIEAEASRFWTEVRDLAGTAALGKILREINRPGHENIERYRLKARVEHLLGEMYLHAGYLKTAIRYCRRALATRLSIYRETLYRTELFSYAKTTLLLTCALEGAGNFQPVLGLLDNAEAAFRAAKAPIDPELHRQRASAKLQLGDPEAARNEFLLAYNAYPAHFEFRGIPSLSHAQHDVGKRPLAIIDRSYDQAMHNLEVSRAWPDGDVHHATNLNAVIATAFFTDSAKIQADALALLPAAREAAEGYGRQMTTVRLLELIPKIPEQLQSDWALFALQYNAYRNR